jgi:tetratricopeptide (TPR) repeat protein
VNATSILLEALPHDDSAALLSELGSPARAPDDRERILSAAEGNPLFLEQLLAADLEGQEGAVPDTLYGLLATRLDRLEGDERTVAEAAAVCGVEFSAASVEELTGLDVLPALAALGRRQLVQVAAEQAFEEETWAFRHVLIREAAYEAVPKRRRASFHEAFARRIVRLAESRGTQWDELAGYHLELAVRCLEEVGEAGASLERLRVEAGERLADAGLRAYERNDVAASASILERATRLLPTDSADRIVVAIRLSSALSWAGAVEEQLRWIEEARAAAERLGDQRLLARVRLSAADNALFTSSALSAEALLTETDEIISVLEAARDHEGLAQAYVVRFHALTRANREGGPTALERGLEHARQADSRYLEGQIVNWYCVTLPRGSIATGAAVERCLELLENPPNRLVYAGAVGALGQLRAMQGAFDEGRALVEEDDEILRDLGLAQASAAHSIARGEVETIAGDFEAAERILRTGIAKLEDLGDFYSRTNAAWRLAIVLCELGRDDEADSWASIAAMAPPTGIYVDIWWRLVRAVVLARRGDAEAAEALLVEARDLAGLLDERAIHADIAIMAAEAYRLVGRQDESTRMLRGAVATATRLEYPVARARASALLTES